MATSTRTKPQPNSEKPTPEIMPDVTAFEMIYDAYGYVSGLQKLFDNMPDQAIEWVEPHEMRLLLTPVSDRLRLLLAADLSSLDEAMRYGLTELLRESIAKGINAHQAEQQTKHQASSP